MVARTMYGWPLGKSFVRLSGIWSVAAMYTASGLRHGLPRALMKSAGWMGPDQWHAVKAAPVRTGCPVLAVLRLCHHLTTRLTLSGPPDGSGSDLFVSQPGVAR